MPSNKIFVVLILAVSSIVSVWLLERKPSHSIVTTKPDSAISVETSGRPEIGSNTDWSKLLNDVDSKSSVTTSVVPTSDTGSFDETTLTAQMSKDLLSRYLLVANKGGNLTQQDIESITTDVLSSPDYNRLGGAVYLKSDLKVINKSDTATLDKYKQTLNQNLAKQIKTLENKTNIGEILNTAIISKGESDTADDRQLAGLDPFVSAFKTVLSDILRMEVPEELVGLHLAMLNAVSSVSSNSIAMRAMFSDPVKGFVGANQYEQSVLDFQTALENINIYYKQKAGMSY